LIEFLNKDMLKGGKKQIRLDSGVGIKPISVTGTKRLVRMAIQHAIENGLKTVTLVHKGNIQKFTEGAFRKWDTNWRSRNFGSHRDGTRELDSGQQRQESYYDGCAERRSG